MIHVFQFLQTVVWQNSHSLWLIEWNGYDTFQTPLLSLVLICCRDMTPTYSCQSQYPGSDMNTEVAGNSQGHVSLYRRACLRSWHEFDFAGMPAVKTCDVSWAGAVMSSYVGVVSQAVPAAYENQVLYMFLRTWWCTTFTKSTAVIVFLSFWSFTPIKTSPQKQRIGAPSWSSQPLFL